MSTTDRSLRNSYALAAGAAAAAAAAAADASIVYSGTQNISISQFSSLNLNLDGDAYGDVLLKNYVFGGGNYSMRIWIDPAKAAARDLTAPEIVAECEVAGFARRTGEHEIAETGQAHQRFRFCAVRACQAREFGKAAGGDSRAGTISQSTTFDDSCGDGEYIFRRAANFNAANIG